MHGCESISSLTACCVCVSITVKITPLDETGWNQVVQTPACHAWNKKEPNGLMRVKVVGNVTGVTAETVFKVRPFVPSRPISSRPVPPWQLQLQLLHCFSGDLFHISLALTLVSRV